MRKKNDPFSLENASKLTHEFLYDIFNKKIYQKCHTNQRVKFYAFIDKIVHLFFFSKWRRLEVKVF